jgi:hypothetical protein
MMAEGEYFFRVGEIGNEGETDSARNKNGEQNRCFNVFVWKCNVANGGNMLQVHKMVCV